MRALVAEYAFDYAAAIANIARKARPHYDDL